MGGRVEGRDKRLAELADTGASREDSVDLEADAHGTAMRVRRIHGKTGSGGEASIETGETRSKGEEETRQKGLEFCSLLSKFSVLSCYG